GSVRAVVFGEKWSIFDSVARSMLERCPELSKDKDRSARPSDSDSPGWVRLDHPGTAAHPLIRLQPVCMLICIGHNDHFVGASITCPLLYHRPFPCHPDHNLHHPHLALHSR